jgi:hypothetical protein
MVTFIFYPNNGSNARVEREDGGPFDYLHIVEDKEIFP